LHTVVVLIRRRRAIRKALAASSPLHVQMVCGSDYFSVQSHSSHGCRWFVCGKPKGGMPTQYGIESHQNVLRTTKIDSTGFSVRAWLWLPNLA